ncbi:putative DNA-binding transcriptional regulator YafY [Motilibacter peucedani]|uniref:Putative DNA-binding transcriptional regulator YafY n=1 Tax=Motilibacter peucedani TaxID=598650 RepID=A0A420XUS6_9ACTN|nr:WYL domain-containing protein [Motilibacter peucedani]RKS80585.1 putative DNA-binding transcriptional regulator YafY [Motilibacter peucedani]
MARPTARVLALLELLQTGGTRTVSELSERLAVDERTVRRYVEHLRDLDVPVDGVRGRYGGYRLARHYRLPPLMLTDEEALAVVWALLLSEQSRSGPASALAVHSATAKIRRVLPEVLAQRVAAVVQVVDFTAHSDHERPHHDRPDQGREQRAPGRDRDHEPGRAEAHALLTLAEAARDRHPVTFGYTTRQGVPAERVVHPYGVVAHRGRLYLTGFDVQRQAGRTFRLDRIQAVAVLDGTFSAPAGSDPVQQVLGPLAPTPALHDVSFRIRTDPAHLRSQIPETLASATPIESTAASTAGWLQVFIRAERLEWVAAALAVLDRPFVIDHPEALRDVVSELGRRLQTGAAAAHDEQAANR